MPLARPFLALALLALGLAAPVLAAPRPQATFITTETFAPNPPISTASGLTNSQAACVEFGSCTTNTDPGVITRTAAPGLTSIANQPTPVAPTDSSQTDAYQSSLAAAGASSAFSSLSNSRDEAASNSSSLSATPTSTPTGLAPPQLAVRTGGSLVAVAAVAVAALLV